ncbi:peroxide stress protein YaaA [Clostridium hydrogeniformans]|uniref:peroxide stress protein YaaA n=1 Tax=Clostridium hydrogeniformans TaxID=349933 RepID=UPI0004888AFC|nr:peroxide stress protein YaaA [Clostridium hydrogeniformans]
MIAIISPAKTLEYDKKVYTDISLEPHFKKESEEIAHILKGYSPEDISSLMKLSEKLSELNFYRFQKFGMNDNERRQSLIVFSGDVYKGINVMDFKEEDFIFAKDHLRILSGIYGILNPLDNIEPYRLEMGTKLKNPKGKDLYDFWKEKSTAFMREELKNHKEKILLNLASEEYSKSIDFNNLGKDTKVVNVAFKEFRNGSYKIIALYAKRARGLMSRYIIKNKIDKLEDIKGFNEEDYKFNEELSSKNTLVFTR